MKIFFTFFILFFSSPIFSKNISEFQIEGISIGDSLLNYYKENFILEYSYDYYDTDVLSFDYEFDYKSASGYDGIQVAFIKNDLKYSVIQIAGIIYYDTKNKNIDNCLKKRIKLLII